MMSQGPVRLKVYRRTSSVGMSTEQEQQDDSEPDTQPESSQGILETENAPPSQAIEFRIKQLHNRHFLLLKMQRLRKKVEDNGTTGEMTCEDQLCELEAIQRELQELLVKKDKLQKQGKHSKLRVDESQQDAHPSCYKTVSPRGGIYMLPPPQQEDITVDQRVKTAAETPTSTVIPVDSLGKTPALTRCPSCEEVVLTKTSSRVGEATWVICCVCTLMGCVAGCCLIPFLMTRVKDIHHQCPQCQANINTYRPFSHGR